MKKRRILIIAYRFPPMNAIASRRWNEMIPCLEEKFDIYVFTMDSAGDLACFLNEDKIQRVGMQENYEIQGEYRISFLHKIVNKFTNDIQTMDSTWFSWFWKFKTDLLEYFDQIQPEIVITTVGPYSTALFAKMLQIKKRKLKWICDIRDPGYLYQLYKKDLFQKFIDRMIEKWLLKTTNLIIATIGDSSIRRLEKLHSKKVHQILNGYLIKDYYRKNRTTKKTLLYYAGQIYPHREAALRLLLSAINNNDDVILNINLLAQPKRRDEILMITNEFDNVNVLLPTSESEVFTTARNSDILVLLENIKPFDEIDLGVIPGKLFGYLPYYAPILAVCSSKSNIAKILDETKKGITSNSKKEICDFINHGYLEYLGDAERIAFYSREKQAILLIELIEKEFYK